MTVTSEFMPNLNSLGVKVSVFVTQSENWLSTCHIAGIVRRLRYQEVVGQLTWQWL